MMKAKHPTYPNPTIQEAVCEIRFELPEGESWRPSVFGELFSELQSEFPILEPAPVAGFRIEVARGKLSRLAVSPPQRMRYRQESGNLQLQLAEGVFTVNVLPMYPGWARMREEVLRAWSSARSLIRPAKITRIGLRYINRIKRAQLGETSGDWLNPSDYVCRAVLSSLPGFVSRLEMRTDPENRLIVTLGEAPAASPEDAGAIVLDIDCIVEKDIGIENEAVMAEMDKLHDLEWDVFAASVSRRLENLLEGGEP